MPYRSVGLAALVAGVVVAGVVHRLRVLTPVASGMAGAFAASLIGWGGWAWALPGALFFGGSALVSRIGHLQKEKHAHRVESSGPRTARQVLANGGVAWLCLGLQIVGPGQALVWYGAALGAFATAAADTWATEVGTLSNRPPRSLRTGQRVPTGTSGAVSVVGTAGAAVGATTVALGAWAGVTLTSTAVVSISAPALIGIVVASGLLGMGADGLAGATLQARYRHPATGEWTERPPAPGAVPARGWSGLRNNAVNLIGTTVGASAAAMLLVGA